MELPISLASSIFAPKGLYYFSSEALNTDEPHYFILVEIEAKVIHLVVCTSKYEKIKRRIEVTGQDPSTLVWVKPSAENKLTKDSYVDCNNVFSHYTLEAAEEKLMSKTLEYRGEISDSEFYQIMNGIISSGNVDKSIVSLIRKTLDEFNK